MEEKICKNCGKQKKISEFPKFLQRDGKNFGIRGTCKKCMNEKYRIPNKKSNKNKPKFTEDEILNLKKFINEFDEKVQKAKLERERNGKEYVSIYLDTSVLGILNQQSKKTGFSKSNIINALLIKEFLQD